jgi:hypothetical protein
MWEEKNRCEVACVLNGIILKENNIEVSVS